VNWRIGEKLKLLEGIREHETASASAWPSVLISVAGFHVRWRFRELSEASRLWLLAHWRGFVVDESADPTQTALKADFEIHYLAQNSRASDEIWSDPIPVFHVDGQKLVCRDFAVWRDLHQTIIVATGPQIDEAAIDTLDNLNNTLLARELMRRDLGFPLHASCVVKDGGAWVVFGPSGAGKSTFARLSYEREGTPVLAGDQLYVRYDSGRPVVWPATTRIPEFPIESEARSLRPAPLVAAARLDRSQPGGLWRDEKFRHHTAFLKEVLAFYFDSDLAQRVMTQVPSCFRRHAEVFRPLVMSTRLQTNPWELVRQSEAVDILPSDRHHDCGEVKT